MAELQDGMPHGWDCRIDEHSGRYYYVNHFTKTTTWDDPRMMRQRTYTSTPKHFSNVHVEHIPLQQGSPDLRRNYVYPSQISPMPAFQMPSSKPTPLQEFRSVSRMSPLTVRSSKVQDSTLTIIPDSDDAVSKISAMFPTVSETHIKLLLKKYHNREALVISALQVEKNPITTPGPFATPPPQRNIQHPGIQNAQHMTPPLGVRLGSRGGSPIFRPGSGTNSTYTGSPRMGSSPRPHSSPKLKLRYMKSVFPQADETVILDILQNNDNNIQKTSEALKDMGFNKKDTVKVAQQKVEAKKEQERKELEKEIKVVQPIVVKTSEEKALMKSKLQNKYKEVADHLITIALESVDFDENRANQILQIMVQEDSQRINKNEIKGEIDGNKMVVESKKEVENLNIPISQSRQSIKSLLKQDKHEKEKLFSRVLEETDSHFKSLYSSTIKGPNPDYKKGPNEKLLLEDYVKWQGPNAYLKTGSSKHLAKGPNSSLLSQRTYKACGPNSDFRKGPSFGLAKGSIFSQLKTVVVGESRGK